MILPDSNLYNLHSHTQFCDGRASMQLMAEAAAAEGMELYGFSPHSPISVESPCNMSRSDVPIYLDEALRITDFYQGRMQVLTGMEIDFLSPDWGPHIDYFQSLPLEYRIGSVHFVPTRDGIPVDCDGRFERFARNLHDVYNDDLRYVVEKYFEQVLTMIERGGFDILGHLDKIAANAAKADPDIETTGWYAALIDDVINHAASTGLIIEINTKSYNDTKRFFPALQWWTRLLHSRVLIVVNSDAHYPDKVNAGRSEALRILEQLKSKSVPLTEI